MAHARLSALIGEIAGNLGPVTFTRAGGSLRINMRKPYPSAASANMINTRCELSRYRTLWAAQTDLTKALWATYGAMNTRKDKLGQARTLSPFLWFSWWVPWAEIGAPGAVAADYDPVPHSILTPPLEGVTLNFSATGRYDIEHDTTWGEAYRAFARIFAAPQGANVQACPRFWIDCGSVEMEETSFDISGILNDHNIYLQEDQAVTIKYAYRVLGAPNYWPSIWSSASTITTA